MKAQAEAAPQALKERFEKHSGLPMTGGPLLFYRRFEWEEESSR